MFGSMMSSFAPAAGSFFGGFGGGGGQMTLADMLGHVRGPMLQRQVMPYPGNTGFTGIGMPDEDEGGMFPGMGLSLGSMIGAGFGGRAAPSDMGMAPMKPVGPAGKRLTDFFQQRAGRAPRGRSLSTMAPSGMASAGRSMLGGFF